MKDKVATLSAAGLASGGKIGEAIGKTLESKYGKNLAAVLWDREIQDDSFIAGSSDPVKAKKDTSTNLG